VAVALLTLADVMLLTIAVWTTDSDVTTEDPLVRRSVLVIDVERVVGITTSIVACMASDWDAATETAIPTEYPAE